MSKKILAVVLSLVMVLGCVPFFANAEEAAPVSSDERVAAWNANLAPVLEKLIDNESSTHWKYVAENNEEIKNTMITYTAFALYDDAWKNGFDKSVSVETAEGVLVSLIEKIDANFGDSKIDEIISVLQTASDVNDFLQKVNGYVKISDTLTSEAWTNTFKYIGYAIKAGNEYKNERERVIEAVARILSVQAANEYYKDFLAYVANSTDYDVVVTACNNLIAHINSSVNEILEDEAGNALAFTGGRLFEVAARVALESNAYTAVALKVYDVGTSVADKLWNTSDQYALMDQLYTTFYVETAASNYAKAAKMDADSELYDFAINALLALRKGGAETLFNLKLAQNQGYIGMVKDQINYNVTLTEADELAFLDLASAVLLDTDVASYVPVTAVVQVNTAANVYMGTVSLLAATAEPIKSACGYFSVVENAAARTAVKTGFVVDGIDVIIASSEDTLATAIVNVIENGNIEDYSFTSFTVGAGKSITFNTAFENGYSFTCGDDTLFFNAEYQYPAYNEVTASSVVNAVTNIVKDEATGKTISLVDAIKAFFDSILAAISNIFSNIKLKK